MQRQLPASSLKCCSPLYYCFIYSCIILPFTPPLLRYSLLHFCAIYPSIIVLCNRALLCYLIINYCVNYSSIIVLFTSTLLYYLLPTLLYYLLRLFTPMLKTFENDKEIFRGWVQILPSCSPVFRNFRKVGLPVQNAFLQHFPKFPKLWTSASIFKQ